MSNAIVLTAVTTAQFVLAISSIEANGKALMPAFHTASLFIAQNTVYKDQQLAKKTLAIAYQSMQQSINGAPFKMESAQTWVMRNVKKLSGVDKFKWLESKAKSAVAKKAQRAKAEAKAEVKTPATPAKKVETIVQLRDALISREKKNCDDYVNQIPAGKIKQFEQAYAAFIITLATILA